jgi:hypothetical protein
MTTPTGTISMSDVNTELGLTSTATISLNDAAVRTLAGVASGTISMDNLRGKSNAPAATFSPDGGTSAGTAVFLSDITYEPSPSSVTIIISCSVSATWTVTRSGTFGVPATGTYTGTERSFNLITGATYRSTTWTVSATANGVTRYWTVQLESEGSGNN